MKKGTLSQRLLVFIGSMNVAITLLLTLAVASVSGTVLQQNQPYADYILKFGPFWFEFFETVGLYDVYGSLWFLTILVLLVTSTTVCVIRQSPSMIRDMLSFRADIQENTLYAMQYQQIWYANGTMSSHVAKLESVLLAHGFRVKHGAKKTEKILLAAMRGGINRLGYIATHLAIIIICFGGLVDSNLPLKLAEWQGNLSIETRDLAVSEIPSESRLSVGAQAFRGSINIPEGRSSNVAFIPMRDGYLVQDLPFRLVVKDFRVAHYKNGQPKSFETDLLLYDEGLDQPISTTISVNHPLFYKGYAIYQSSFSDGGSRLTVDVIPLHDIAENKITTIETKVFERRTMHWKNKSFQLEMDSFRLFNINPDPTEDNPNRVRNFGPSIGFKLREKSGEAREYLNYMLPITRNSRQYYLSGVRSSPAEEFGYLYLPLDADDSLDGLSHFLMQLNDKAVIERTANQIVAEKMASMAAQDNDLANSLRKSLSALVVMFVKGGFDDVRHFTERVLPDDERDKLSTIYLTMLHDMLNRIYFSDLAPSLVEYDLDRQLLFLQDAVDAIGSLPRYGSPVYLLTTDYDHVEASGLQVTRSPGKVLVYFGCALLIAGIFLLFYLPQVRLWVMVSAHGSKTKLLFSGMTNRQSRDFSLLFNKIASELKYKSGNY